MFDAEPEGWEQTTLGAVCVGKGEYGANVPRRDFDPRLPRYVRITDISDTGTLLPDSLASISLTDAADYMLAPGDLLLARSGATVGKSFFYDENYGPCAFAGYLIRFRPDPTRIDPYFARLSVDTPRFWAWVKTVNRAGAQPNINAQEYATLPILLPPLREQRRIAEVLRAVDETIAATAQTLDRANRLLADARITMTGLDGSSPGWRRGPLLDFFQLQRGHDLPVQDRIAGPIPVIASNGPVGSHNVAAIPAPAVVTGRSGTIGKVTYFDGPCWPLNTTLFVRDFKGSNPRYVFHFLNAFPLGDYQSGTGVPTLNRNDVHAVEVPWPPVAEQEMISATLDSIEQVARYSAEELDRLIALKKQMNGDLSSGRVRVPT